MNQEVAYRTPRFDLYIKSQERLRRMEREVPELKAKFLCGNINTADINKWIEYQNELEKTAPYGRCELCNSALMGDEHYRKTMHDNCAVDHYGD